jgi:hypothetical protein
MSNDAFEMMIAKRTAPWFILIRVIIPEKACKQKQVVGRPVQLSGYR